MKAFAPWTQRQKKQELCLSLWQIRHWQRLTTSRLIVNASSLTNMSGDTKTKFVKEQLDKISFIILTKQWRVVINCVLHSKLAKGSSITLRLMEIVDYMPTLILASPLILLAQTFTHQFHHRKKLLQTQNLLHVLIILFSTMIKIWETSAHPILPKPSVMNKRWVVVQKVKNAIPLYQDKGTCFPINQLCKVETKTCTSTLSLYLFLMSVLLDVKTISSVNHIFITLKMENANC